MKYLIYFANKRIELLVKIRLMVKMKEEENVRRMAKQNFFFALLLLPMNRKKYVRRGFLK